MSMDQSDGLSERDFRRLATYIENVSGIKMPPSKMTMVEGRLRKRLRATGLNALSARNGMSAVNVTIGGIAENVEIAHRVPHGLLPQPRRHRKSGSPLPTRARS